MTEAMRWAGPETAGDGVIERGFRLSRGAGIVPAVLWRPATLQRVEPPLVLLGHGGSGHKRHERNVALARWFAVEHGLAALAIDGPYHGDRVPAPMPAAEYQPRVVAEGTDRVMDRMRDDWLAAVDAVAGLADAGNVGYLGMSMGARYGLALAAALGGRLRCAVLGKFGLRQSPAMPAGLARPDRAAADARLITAPTLQHVQWDDELFPRDGQFALFEAFGSAGKELTAYPGAHAVTRPEAVVRWREFMAGHLTRDQPGGDGREPGSVRDNSL